MKEGDEILFYHSSCEVVGIVGLARIVGFPHPDETQFDPKSKYYDSRATKEKPVWICVDVAFIKKYPRVLTI
jgi:predicted RNA-binding protein with PUA-like domain